MKEIWKALLIGVIFSVLVVAVLFIGLLFDYLRLKWGILC